MTQQPDLLLALAMFCVVTLFTPGPNNIMLMTSGLNFGFKRALPHLFGVAGGFAAMVFGVGIGLGAVFEAVPILYVILKYGGAAYLLYLAWRISQSGPLEANEDGAAKPITFLQAAAFQWVNPKAWVMAVGAITAYGAVAQFPINVALTAGLFGTLGIVSSGTWIGFGHAMQRIINNPRSLRLFNYAMALMLAASLIPVFV